MRNYIDKAKELMIKLRKEYPQKINKTINQLKNDQKLKDSIQKAKTIIKNTDIRLKQQKQNINQINMKQTTSNMKDSDLLDKWVNFRDQKVVPKIEKILEKNILWKKIKDSMAQQPKQTSSTNANSNQKVSNSFKGKPQEQNSNNQYKKAPSYPREKLKKLRLLGFEYLKHMKIFQLIQNNPQFTRLKNKAYMTFGKIKINPYILLGILGFGIFLAYLPKANIDAGNKEQNIKKDSASKKSAIQKYDDNKR